MKIHVLNVMAIMPAFKEEEKRKASEGTSRLRRGRLASSIHFGLRTMRISSPSELKEAAYFSFIACANCTLKTQNGRSSNATTLRL